MSKMVVFLLLLFPLLAASSAPAQVAKENPLMTKDLPDVPGKQGLVETVVLSPGEIVPAHRHDADVFAYVLEGSVITQVRVLNPRQFMLARFFTNRPRMYTLLAATRVQRNRQRFSSSLRRRKVLRQLWLWGQAMSLPKAWAEE